MKRKPIHRPGVSDVGKPDPKRPRKKHKPHRTHDLSQLQFDAALKRHGLYKQLLWIYSHELPGKGIGAILRGGGKGIDRRATLARAIREFKAMEAK